MEHLTYPQLMFVLRGRHRSHYAKDNTWPFKSSLVMKKEISKKYIVSLGIRPQYFQLRILRTRPYAIFPV